MQRSIGVTLSAVLVFTGCGFTLLLLGLGVLALALTRQPNVNLPIVHVILIFEVVFGFAFAAWGIASGLGLLNLREWARISMVVFSALMLFFSLIPLLIFAFLPIPQFPGTPPNFVFFMRVGVSLFYGFFAALGGFWLYFFNRRNVREQFRPLPSVDLVTAMSNAQEIWVTPSEATPHRPILIVLVAILFLLGSCIFPFIYLLHSPMFFFGVALQGGTAAVCMAVFAVLGLVAGVGLIRLRPWGWVAALAYQALGLVNMACLVFIPGASDRMFEAITQYESARGMPPMPADLAFSMVIMRISLIFGIVFGVGILWALFAYRRSFRPIVPAAI
ncbi:MAG: hypothetical protein ACRD40_12050 [Candidatus Acidiferrales bacterium]